MKRTRWTTKVREAFLKTLADTGNVTEAATLVGISRARAYELRNEDPDFAAGWEDAEQVAADALEKEARRRAIEGVDEPVFQGGELVGVKRKYSDVLLIFLLNGIRPEKYKQRVAQEVSGKDGKPIQHETKNTGGVGVMPVIDVSRLSDDDLATLDRARAVLAQQLDPDSPGVH